MLVKLVQGSSINPEVLKHIYMEQKTLNGKKTWIIQAKLDDNTLHPIAFFAKKDAALECIKECVKKINDAE